MTSEQIREALVRLPDPKDYLVTDSQRAKDKATVIEAARAYADLIDSDALVIQRDENGEWPEWALKQIHHLILERVSNAMPGKPLTTDVQATTSRHLEMMTDRRSDPLWVEGYKAGEYDGKLIGYDEGYRSALGESS